MWEAVDKITLIEWENFCKNREIIERKHWDTNNLLEIAIDNLKLDIESTNSEQDQDDSNSLKGL